VESAVTPERDGPTTAEPAWSGYFADPFVWSHDGVYWAVGTGGPEAKSGFFDVATRAARAGVDTRVFPVLRSEDLRRWSDAGAAMVPPDPAFGDHLWAPEVAVRDGRFHLYYSAGRINQVRQLRVATSERPDGPYVDAGVTLLHPFECYFANDPHPFRDVDGEWYLFYQRDFVDTDGGHRIGGGIVVDRLLDMVTLAGEPQVVVRPRFDWQRFDPQRERYGQVWDWHLLEGPFVLHRGGRYHCFYSGGNWEDHSYGVDVAVADSLQGPWSDDGAADGPRVLRTIPGVLTGPGHSSVVTTPDGVDHIAFHAWDSQMRDRRLHIEPLVWTADGPRCRFSPGPRPEGTT
jgi:beta-xylosidase